MQKGFIEPGEKPKRFYKDVTVVAEDGAFSVKLDGRNVRSPKGGKLSVPTKALAEMVAAEWDAPGTHSELAALHITRLACTATAAGPQARAAPAQTRLATALLKLFKDVLHASASHAKLQGVVGRSGAGNRAGRSMPEP